MKSKQRKANDRANLATWYVKDLIIKKGFRPNDISEKDVEDYRIRLLKFRERNAKNNAKNRAERLETE